MGTDRTGTGTAAVSTLPWLEEPWRRVRERIEADRMTHALLVRGPRGCGKRILADQLAQLLLCTEPVETACGQCRSCQLFSSGAHPDFFRVTPPEGKFQVRVDDVREMIGQLALTPSFSPRKLALIVPAERMNLHSANALLKNLEEPPGDKTVVLLVSDDPRRLPITIRSRCQDVVVPVPDAKRALAWLAGQGLDEATARTALEASGGSPFRALEFHQAGRVETWSQLRESLESLRRAPATVSASAAIAAEVEPDVLWGWLSLMTAESLKRMMGEGEQSARLAQFSQLQRQADRNRQLSETAVRQDLLLQDWLLEWARS